jgi:hypothetical protein
MSIQKDEAISLHRGTIDDAINSLDLICKLIPKKADLTPDQLIARLNKRQHGIYLARHDKDVVGITIWYEEKSDLYLWLGAIKLQSRGIMTNMLKMIKNDTNYDRWFVKISIDDYSTRSFLQNRGFEVYEHCQDQNVAYLQLFL